MPMNTPSRNGLAAFGANARVLKDNGLLVFTYHHSRAEGWSSILRALMEANLAVVAAHPIKAEMSGATPKQQAKEPIDLDIILVCRKRGQLTDNLDQTDLWSGVNEVASHQVSRLRNSGRILSLERCADHRHGPSRALSIVRRHSR